MGRREDKRQREETGEQGYGKGRIGRTRLGIGCFALLCVGNQFVR
jgi:hypothetical protein